MQQKTIKQPIHAEGIGLHSGQSVALTLHPAEDNTGIVFQRRGSQEALAVCVEHVVEAPLCTMLKQGEHQIATIEHLMAAFCAMQIDNVRVELTSDEVPVMDGSSAPFIFLIQSAGVHEQESVRRMLRIGQPVRIEEEDKFVELLPADRLGFDISIDFPDPAIQATSQAIQFQMIQNSFIKEVSRARTFGQADQLEQLHQMNRALGASLDNAVGLQNGEVMNPEGLRYPDEFVRHKLLDCIGDLYVAGPIIGHFRGHKMSHALNNRLLRAVLADQQSHCWVG